MKVVFRYHERARPGLEAWVRHMATFGPEGRRMTRVILADIQDQLTRRGRDLTNVTPDRNSEPPLYWWRYYPGFWISFVVRDRGFWKWRTRRVIVYSVGERPPDRVVESTPRV